MFFRNLTMFRFSHATALDTVVSSGDLGAHLESKRLRPCGPLEQSTRGFVSPFGLAHDVLTHAVGEFVLVAIGAEDRMLPAAVVNAELALRLQKIRDEQDRRVGAKERKRMKDEILTDFLPRAFVKPSRMLAYLDLKNGWLVVDTSSRKSAEEALSQLREAVGSFPATPMAPEESPRTLMTDWVVSGQLPAGFALADDCELRDPADGGAIVRCRRQDLETDEVREHLKSGKQVYQLGLVFDDRISFVLGEDLVVRKLRFLDQVLDDLQDADDAAADLDSRFALMTLELARLLAKLDELFRLPRPTDR